MEFTKSQKNREPMVHGLGINVQWLPVAKENKENSMSRRMADISTKKRKRKNSTYNGVLALLRSG
jgi:hypothetical protein